MRNPTMKLAFVALVAASLTLTIAPTTAQAQAGTPSSIDAPSAPAGYASTAAIEAYPHPCGPMRDEARTGGYFYSYKNCGTVKKKVELYYAPNTVVTRACVWPGEIRSLGKAGPGAWIRVVGTC